MRSDFLKLEYGESGNVIKPFLSRLYLERNPRKVYWVSPWIRHLSFQTATTKDLLQKLRNCNVYLIVITREPELGSKHEEFVEHVKELPNASIFYMYSLHAKFYLAETKERRYALLGSANMYQSKSFEIGITIEARGDGEVLVDELEHLAIDLRVMRNTKAVK